MYVRTYVYIKNNNLFETILMNLITFHIVYQHQQNRYNSGLKNSSSILLWLPFSYVEFICFSQYYWHLYLFLVISLFFLGGTVWLFLHTYINTHFSHAFMFSTLPPKYPLFTYALLLCLFAADSISKLEPLILDSCTL